MGNTLLTMTPCGSCGKRVLGVAKERWTRSERPRLRQLPQAAPDMLAPNDGVTFVESGDEHVTEVDRPDAIFDLLGSDRMWREGVGNKEQPPWRWS